MKPENDEDARFRMPFSVIVIDNNKMSVVPRQKFVLPFHKTRGRELSRPLVAFGAPIIRMFPSDEADVVTISRTTKRGIAM
jgi:hypothetical protein